MLFGESEHVFQGYFDFFHRSARPERIGGQQSLSHIGMTLDFLQANARYLERQESGRHQATGPQAFGNELGFRLAEQERGEGGSVQDLNDHPGRLGSFPRLPRASRRPGFEPLAGGLRW